MSQDAGATGPAYHQRQGWTSLMGVGVWVLIGPSQLNIMWDNGSSAVLRFGASAIFAHVERVPGADMVQLHVNVQMETSRGIRGIWFALLPFPGRSAPAVQRLAELLAATDQPTDPSPATPDAPMLTAQPAAVRIRAWPGYWADDPDWVGLYPTRETERLLMMPADQPAEPTEYPQVT